MFPKLHCASLRAHLLNLHAAVRVSPLSVEDEYIWAVCFESQRSVMFKVCGILSVCLSETASPGWFDACETWLFSTLSQPSPP